jgi:hypothetical protein
MKLSGAPLLGKLLALPTRLQRPARDEHCSLLDKFVSYEEKKVF